MQCKSYLPVHNSHFDFNVDTNSGSKLMCNGNGTFRSGNLNNLGPTLCVPQADFCFKDLLRQTMLMQEVTFKDQVQELHHIYRRHRELMTEFKTKETYMSPLHLSSNSSTAILTSSCGQAFHCITGYKAPDVTVSLRDGTLDKLLEPKKVKKIGGKILDLELPAEVYIDSDEWESLGEAQYTECATSASLPSCKRSKFVLEASKVNSQLDPDPTLQGEFSSPCSIQVTSGCITDLTEPPSTFHLENCDRLPEKEATSKVLERNDDSFHYRNAISNDDHKTPSCRLGKNTLVVQALPSLNNQTRSITKAKFSCRSKGSVEQKFNSFNSRQNIVTAKENGVISLNSLDAETMRKSKKYHVIDINLPCDPASDDEPCCEDDLAGHDCKISGQVDLNICMTDDGLPKTSSCFDKDIMEKDLEAPISPVIEERPPPRGDPEGDHTLGKRALVAAEAIVSMSCKTLLFSKIKDQENCQVSDSGGLEWFAGLVHSLSTALDTDDVEEIDDFEAMTLNLTETKPEEYLCKYSVEISSQTCSMSMIGQTIKGRTRSRRRSKRKDFQREVLPSIASLSRYEVTEDIHIIEGFMGVAGTPWHLRSRRACRTGRKPRVIKHHTPPTDVSELKGDFVTSWGKDNRRPRGRRSPVSPDGAMSRWLEFAV